MHLEQLECIVEVAKTGSLTGAANNLHVTLSAVSQSISNLEAELGVALFTRSRLGAAPTAEGEVIIGKALEVLGKLQELKEEAVSYSNVQRGELRLATIPGPLTLYMNAIIGYKKDYPHVRLELFEKGTQEIIDDIRHNKLDMGLIIMFEEHGEKHAGLTIDPLLEGRMVACVSRKSALALNKSISPEELSKHPLVLYNDDYLKWYMERIEQRYGPVQILFSTNNKDAIRIAVQGGAAITVGIDFSFYNQPEHLRDDFVIIELEPTLQVPIHLSWVGAKDKRLSNTAKIFVNKLKHELQKL
ncbi:LysR family transcriptional regulator [Paenibacillus doosanensis]|uniref:HTH-type transcriptional activator CmpR n=1 Tax=Paenibacillus konkukensis TaxID=2020716 RepID=A0ABY4RGU5_9BACL|nr:MULTISPECIES: LysR family transcriptional regulator [Paenibacillus]MCS7462333.1 LysR family transcriptional regulator [Paenibacillus doosanensis]UQZ80854.1 HTH-type transcriptional activator CmpR [Paenibacillus konkukensis]